MSISSRTVLAAAISIVLSGNVWADAAKSTEKETAPVVEQQVNMMTPKMLSFEEASVPDYVSIDGEGSVDVTKKRFLNGSQSLIWKYEPNAPLVIDQSFNFYPIKTIRKEWGRWGYTVLSTWVYNEEANDGELEFKLGSSTAKAKLNFTGWRAIGFAVERDMNGMPSSVMDGLSITPKTDKPGQLYIDRVMVSIDDARYQWSDYTVMTAIDVPEIDFKLPKELPQASAEEIVGVTRIKNDLINYYIKESKASAKVLRDIDKEFANIGLTQHADGVINGPHIITKKQNVIYQVKHMNAYDKALVDGYYYLRPFSELMSKIARTYLVSNDAAVRQDLANKYILMSKHLLDQGFQKGSGLIATHHWGYASRDWYESILLMEDELIKANLMKPVHDALLWYSREFNERGFGMFVNKKSLDMDYLNTLLLAQLSMTLTVPDQNERVALMNKFSDFMSANLTQVPVGYEDGFRPDGTAWRHKGNYPGYSFAALSASGHLAYLLRGTLFELSTEARQVLKKTMLAARTYSNNNPGLGVIGRRPFFKTSVDKVATGMRYLALAGVESNQVDKELASAYLRIEQLSEKDGTKIFKTKVTPESHPQGFTAFNYAAMGIHRFSDKMATMKGWNKYVWSSEIYGGGGPANRYGRYQSHGTVQIHKFGEESDYGYDQNGWDWNRPPGGTTIHLPWELLDAPNPHTTMLVNDVKFNGATSLDGKYGTFGFILQNPTRYAPVIDPAFTAKKAVFSFDNRLVLTGNDIRNNNSEYPTETTLFQHGITQLTDSLNVNGEKITQFPYEATLTEGDWLIDGMGNGYYIVKGAEIQVRRQAQESRDNQKKQPTFGNFQSAWINHGVKPDNAEYEYIVILDATPAKMAQVADAVKAGDVYEVVQKNSNVHVVRDKATGATGYSVFSFARITDKYVRAVSTSSLVMTQPEGEDKLKLSVANPDLNMEKNTLSDYAPVMVTLHGAWELTGEHSNVKADVKGSKTTVSFMCKDGLPIQVTLKKA
ncbi:chondroitinase family polysaccharide lyase [Vibrio fujianensis]|uniref:chondroitinase family polysaccharide lyase n=1 Tax=Vibrio fujianensis TaxID=1974215 RepID=UPI000C16A7F0|nr:chondroitinase family polysaccharide lyase [Vibrio fujianensis]